MGRGGGAAGLVARSRALRTATPAPVDPGRRQDLYRPSGETGLSAEHGQELPDTSRRADPTQALRYTARRPLATATGVDAVRQCGYIARLKQWGIVPSMAAKGNPYENSMMA